MERTQVSSTNIVSVGYDAENQLLEVEFISGAVYQYSSVPPGHFEGIMAAESKGSYFNAQIRNVYPFAKQ